MLLKACDCSLEKTVENKNAEMNLKAYLLQYVRQNQGMHDTRGEKGRHWLVQNVVEGENSYQVPGANY